ncbi:MAG: hypothetical protein GC201_05385 [Alphaproteobacteria bacterium]|nr:hypothetical protein [Alphaproteobacteria bacterium]
MAEGNTQAKHLFEALEGMAWAARELKQNISAQAQTKAVSLEYDFSRFSESRMNEAVVDFTTDIETETTSGDHLCWSMTLRLNGSSWEFWRTLSKREGHGKTVIRDLGDRRFESVDNLVHELGALTSEFIESCRHSHAPVLSEGRG